MNHTIFLRASFRYFLLCFLSFFAFGAAAQTSFTHGLDASSTPLIWFKPDTSVVWVDVHYDVGNGQQNLRMGFNNVRFEQVISASAGTKVIYWFTYSINGSVAFDTAQFSAVVPNASSSSSLSQSSVPSSRSSSLSSSLSSSSSSRASSSSGSGVPLQGISDGGSRVTFWLQPTGVAVPWADVHYTVNGGVQQNVSMSFNSSAARYEHNVSVTANAPLSINYSFTYQGTSGAVDTAVVNFTRSSSSSSSSSSFSSSSSKSSVSSSASSVAIDVDKSLFVHDTLTLQSADFSLRSLLQQLVTQLNAINPGNPTTPEQLFARMWDTQNVPPGKVIGGDKCTGTLNNFAVECRPAEGAQADNPALFINNYIPIGLVNRLDLRDDVNFNDCGEYRIIFANQGGGRNLVIFEAQLPNPNPGVVSGCLPIAQFWQNLSAQTDAVQRATLLRKFFFEGISGVSTRPVIDIRNYAEGTGQIRANMFMGSSWDLKEFKVGIDSQGLSMIKPVTVKSNPVAFLFDGNQTDTRAQQFQQDFVNDMDRLLKDFNHFSLLVSDVNNNGQSHASGPIDENLYGPAFFNTNANAFQQAVSNKLAALGSNLTPAQVMNRATAMSCGGCHQPDSFGLTSPNAIGPNQMWPTTLGFTHISEFANAGVFPLSPALVNVFLPFRLSGFKAYLANPALTGSQVISNSLMMSSGSSSTAAKPKKFGKRSG